MHRYGQYMGTLLVQCSDSDGDDYTTVWTKSQDQGDAWSFAELQSGDVATSGGNPAQTIRFLYTR